MAGNLNKTFIKYIIKWVQMLVSFYLKERNHCMNFAWAQRRTQAKDRGFITLCFHNNNGDSSFKFEINFNCFSNLILSGSSTSWFKLQLVSLQWFASCLLCPNINGLRSTLVYFSFSKICFKSSYPSPKSSIERKVLPVLDLKRHLITPSEGKIRVLGNFWKASCLSTLISLTHSVTK